MALNGTYCGIVEDNRDPEGLGRLKIRVPAVYGAVGSSFGAIPTESIPWALPMGLPAGGSNASGGFSMLPEKGDQVAVQFLDAEPEKPVWQWLMQTRDQAKALKLHEYTGGSPDRAILTRYGHSLELKSGVVTLTTGEGQQVLLQTSQSAAGGKAALQTPKGQRVELNDLAQGVVIQGLDAAVLSAAKVMLNAPTSTLVKTSRFTLMVGSTMVSIQQNSILVTTESGASIVIDDLGNIAVNSAGGASVSVENDKIQIAEPQGTGLVIENGKISINGTSIVLNTASFQLGMNQPSWPVLLLDPQMRQWLLTHTHTNGNNGSPTGPPIPADPSFPDDAASQTMQTT